MQMVINLAPVSLSNKKVNFYVHFPKIDFSEKKKKCHGKCLQEHFCFSRFQIFLGGISPDPPSSSRKISRNLPRLVLKSGYGPDHSDYFYGIFIDFLSSTLLCCVINDCQGRMS